MALIHGWLPPSKLAAAFVAAGKTVVEVVAADAVELRTDGSAVCAAAVESDVDHGSRAGQAALVVCVAWEQHWHWIAYYP